MPIPDPNRLRRTATAAVVFDEQGGFFSTNAATTATGRFPVERWKRVSARMRQSCGR